MTAWKFLVLFVLAPSVATAQAGSLDAARRAKATSEQASEERMKAADAAYDSDGGGSAGTVNLNSAAEMLQGEGDGGGGGGASGNLSGAPPDIYTVKEGDTLWDLSGRFLGNTWYWPKVWSYNPHISNPHWIYPGNEIRFYMLSEEGPAQVEPGDLSAPVALDDDTVAVVGPYKIGYVPPKGTFVRRDSFVTPRELEDSGIISASFEEKMMLSTYDKAYAQFRNRASVKPGEIYVVYRNDGPVKHPLTGQLIGYQATVIGNARVTAIDDRAATLIIGSTYEPIERGTLLAPWTERLTGKVSQRPNQRELDGTIVATPTPSLTQIGEHHLVFIDRGLKDGVQEGNTFSVIRSGDPYKLKANEIYRDPSLPKEDVGTLLVVDAREQSSVALVTRSMRELFVGDRVEMRLGVGSARAPVPAAK